MIWRFKSRRLCVCKHVRVAGPHWHGRPDRPPPTGPSRRSHNAEVVTYSYAHVVRCRDCSFGQGVRYESRTSAREACDAHMIWTHQGGGYDLGHARCGGCRAVRRQQRKMVAT